MCKNSEKSKKHVRKNRRSEMLACFPPNLLIKDFIFSDVIGSFLVVSNWQRRWQRHWHPLNANWTKELSVAESKPIT